MAYRGSMDPQPKDDAARANSIRLNKLMTYLVRIPLACVLLPCGWLKRLMVRRTPAQLRTADKGHQSEVRRQLRGLTPVHDAGKHVS
jgi:hypothetical protein